MRVAPCNKPGMAGGFMNWLKVALTGVAVVVAMRGGSVDAAEIKVLASGSLKGALSRLAPDFQKSSGNTVTKGRCGRRGDRIQIADREACKQRQGSPGEPRQRRRDRARRGGAQGSAQT